MMVSIHIPRRLSVAFAATLRETFGGWSRSNVMTHIELALRDLMIGCVEHDNILWEREW